MCIYKNNYKISIVLNYKLNLDIGTVFTLSFKAFLRKKALQLSHVTALKLYPKALSPQTAQTLLDFSPFLLLVVTPFSVLMTVLGSMMAQILNNLMIN